MEDINRINAEIDKLFLRRQIVLRSNMAQQLNVTDAPMHLLNLKLDGLLSERDYWAHEQFYHLGFQSGDEIVMTLRHIDAEILIVNERRKLVRDEGPLSANETLQSINHALISLLCADRDLRLGHL